MQNGLYVFSFDNIKAGYINGYIYFNNDIPLQNAEIKSILNHNIYYTNNEGYFDFGHPEGSHLFTINNTDTLEINIVPHLTTSQNFYLDEDLARINPCEYESVNLRSQLPIEWHKAKDFYVFDENGNKWIAMCCSILTFQTLEIGLGCTKHTKIR